MPVLAELIEQVFIAELLATLLKSIMVFEEQVIGLQAISRAGVVSGDFRKLSQKLRRIGNLDLFIGLRHQCQLIESFHLWVFGQVTTGGPEVVRCPFDPGELSDLVELRTRVLNHRSGERSLPVSGSYDSGLFIPPVITQRLQRVQIHHDHHPTCQQ